MGVKTLKRWALVSALTALPVEAQMTTELNSETLQEFERYVGSVESVLQERTDGQRSFLWLGENPGNELGVRRGGIVVHQFDDDVISVAEGLLHHWIGVMFVPGGNLEETVELLQDFDRHPLIYPEVVEAELLGKEGNIVRSRMKTKKKKILEVVLDMELEAHHQELDEDRYVVRSYTNSIREVKNPGTAEETELPDGRGTGFLWRLYSYWRLQQADGGVYVELETVSLTRDIPFGLGFIIKPFIRDVPKESLESTLRATRNALMD